MADTTPQAGWDMTHVLAVVGGAAAGAALLPVVAPVALGAVGLTAAASALGFSSLTAGASAIIGGWIGHKVAKPS